MANIIEGGVGQPEKALGTSSPQPPSRSDWGGIGQAAAPGLQRMQGGGGFNPFMFSQYKTGATPKPNPNGVGQFPFYQGFGGMPFRFNSIMPWRGSVPQVGNNGITRGAQPQVAPQPQGPPQQPQAQQQNIQQMLASLFGMGNPLMGGR